MKKGIDVSAHNHVDWSLAKECGIEFSIIRAGYGYGNGKDKLLYSHVSDCEANGIPYGFYWASYAANVNDARKEAEECLNIIKDYSPTYPIYHDWEDFSFDYAKLQGLADKTKGKDFSTVFCEEVEKAGYFAGIYTNYNMYKNVFTPELFNRFSLWLAYWDVKSLPITAPMWQYKVENTPFATGKIDFNQCIYDFPEIIKNMKKPEGTADKCPCSKCPYRLEE